jgi:hypothetical protein
MGKLGDSADAQVKMAILKMATDMLANGNWAKEGDPAKEVKRTIDQLAESYNEL